MLVLDVSVVEVSVLEVSVLDVSVLEVRGRREKGGRRRRRRRRRRSSGYSPKNNKPTRQCGEKLIGHVQELCNKLQQGIDHHHQPSLTTINHHSPSLTTSNHY